MQRQVRRVGAKFTGYCQFGEASQGNGEYFAIVALTTDTDFEIGQGSNGIPRGAKYSRVKIVKRR